MKCTVDGTDIGNFCFDGHTHDWVNKLNWSGKYETPAWIWGTYGSSKDSYVFSPGSIKVGGASWADNVNWSGVHNPPFAESSTTDSNGKTTKHLRIPDQYNLYVGTYDSNLYLGSNVYSGTITDSYLPIGVCPAGGNYPGMVRVTKKNLGSSIRFKKNVKPWVASKENKLLDPHQLYKIPLVTFTYKESYLDTTCDLFEKEVIGIISEDLEKLMPTAVRHINGQVEGWRESILIPAMIYLLQEQKKEIDGLKDRITLLEEKVNTLVATL